MGLSLYGLRTPRKIGGSVIITNSTTVGSYLFQRVLADGHDSRFDEIKKSPPKFFGAFMAQATWVSLCLMPVLAINSIPHTLLSTLPAVTLTDIIGLSLFTVGLTFEIMADWQKNAWVQEKKQKKHDEDFLTRGLWSKSRHPNYFGESVLWTGIAVTATGVLAGKVGQAGMGLGGSVGGRVVGIGLCAVSPAFVTFLLFKVSGIPLSETKYDKKYGDRKDYQEWKKNTPVFIPKF
jgi:steroid 5-alpha reductase family enzyme